MNSKTNPVAPDKSRDADRSRDEILGAAERIFAERGFEGASLGEIAAAAGLSRGTPSYFFGSKADLYRSVLERSFAQREKATREACRPLADWAGSDRDEPFDGPLEKAIEGYLDFLLERPNFHRLILREELAGGSGLRDVPRASKAFRDAFAAVRKVAESRGLRPFDVDDVVLVVVSLTFFPASQGSTFMASLKRDLDKKATRRRHVRLVAGQVMSLIG
jgi:AcrR family transcriptional regulator